MKKAKSKQLLKGKTKGLIDIPTAKRNLEDRLTALEFIVGTITAVLTPSQLRAITEKISFSSLTEDQIRHAWRILGG
jgi:hypothetical protein